MARMLLAKSVFQVWFQAPFLIPIFGLAEQCTYRGFLYCEACFGYCFQQQKRNQLQSVSGILLWHFREADSLHCSTVCLLLSPLGDVSPCLPSSRHCSFWGRTWPGWQNAMDFPSFRLLCHGCAHALYVATVEDCTVQVL